VPRDGRLSAERPFPGLRPFEFSESAFFFGRAEQIFGLYRLLELSQFVAVVGSSGSGKSSIVRAGLLPVLAEESKEAAESGAGGAWRWIELRPGDAPLGRLADRLAEVVAPAAEASENEVERLARRERIEFALSRSSLGLVEALAGSAALAGRKLLIVVDQFEELFRYTASGPGRDRFRDEAALFVQLLLEATGGPDRQVHVIITLRSDFIGECARFYGLPEAVSGCQFLVPALARDQREEIIRRPLEAAAASIEPALVEQLLNDAGDDLDQLPVLQHCLQQLWEEAQQQAPPHQRPHLTPRNYIAIGGMQQALSRHADKIMGRLRGDELAVEQAFRALSELDAERRATRRALPFAQLLAETGVSEEALRRVLDRFRADDCSFIVPSPEVESTLKPGTRIDVGHEALLRRWQRISAEPVVEVGAARLPGGWLYQESADGQFYRALLALLEGGGTLPLDQVEARWRWWSERPRTAAWAERYGGRLEEVVRLFANSRKALAAEGQRKQWTRVGMGAAFAAVVVLAGAFAWQWRMADRQRAEAVAALKLEKAAEMADAADKTRLKSMIAVVVHTEDGVIFQVIGKYVNPGNTHLDGVPAALLQDILGLTIGALTQLEQGGETSTELRYDEGVANGKKADLLLEQGDKAGSLAAAQQSRKIFAKLAKDGGGNDVTRELDLADERMGRAYQALLNLNQALTYYQDEVKFALRLAKKDPSNIEWLNDLALAYEYQGNALMLRKAAGDLDQALASYRQEATEAEVLAKKDPSHTQGQNDMLVAYASEGDTLMLRSAPGDVEQALSLYEAQLAVSTALAKKDPSNPQWQRDKEIADNKIGDAYAAQEKPDQALASYERAAAIAETLGNKNPSNIEWQNDLSYTANRLEAAEEAELKVHDAAAALAAGEAWLTLRRQLYAEAPTKTAKSNLVDALGSVSFVLLLNHRPKDAFDRAAEALRLDPNALWVEANRAHALLFLGRFDEAKAIYLEDAAKPLDDGRTFGAAVKADFAQFREFGIDTGDMQRIQALLQ